MTYLKTFSNWQNFWTNVYRWKLILNLCVNIIFNIQNSSENHSKNLRNKLNKEWQGETCLVIAENRLYNFIRYISVLLEESHTHRSIKSTPE